ncbi:MAG: glycogen synthase [Solirubrobacterales bacterium]|jgi:glycosyltransferase involved in cell wall biosynthesis|nr:glycogen synthase [Solirubrobacterales bacterium]
MRVLLVSSEHGRDCGLGISVGRLGRLLAREHEVTVVHAYEDAAPIAAADDPPSLRNVIVDPSRLPPIAFTCDDHARSAAVAAAIEEAYGDQPPDYAEFPDYRGHALVPLQARAAGSPSLRGTEIAIRLRGLAALMCLYDGTWPQPEHRMVFDLEREALRLCDRIVYPGESVLDTYRTRTEGIELDVAERVRLSFEPGPEPEAAARQGEGPLRILFAGRLQRVKGVLPLVEACLEAEDPNWRLTLVGGDTDTAPMNQSVRMTIESMVGEDERIEIRGPVPHEELQRLYGEHDLVAVPSYFEAWSNVALEAMRAGIPILACPSGGLAEIVADGVSGWHTEGTGREPILKALERLLADRAEVERVRASGAPRARFLELTDEDAVLGAYRDLLSVPHPPRPQKRFLENRFCGLGDSGEPLVTGVVTYFGERETVREAVDSLLAQTHRNLEVVVVNDGSFEAEDRILFELAGLDRVRVLHKPNGGESTARNLAVVDADGEYLAFLDADNTLEPGFVARAVAMIEADPEIAYVTSWLRFFGDEEEARVRAGASGYAPLGNAVRSDDAINSDGDAIALMPRRLFTREGYAYEEDGVLMADWEFYRRLREGGRFGAVMPVLEANYRMRPGSLSYLAVGDLHALAWDEALSRRRLRALEGAGS